MSSFSSGIVGPRTVRGPASLTKARAYRDGEAAASARPAGTRASVRPLLEWRYLRSWPFLFVNLACFAAVCAFREYLAGGGWFDFSWTSYLADLATAPGEAMLRPLSAASHPWMILVTGMLLAAMIYVPLMTAVLYPLPFTVLFVAACAVLAHMPALAAASLAGCVMAARTPLRNDMPFCAIVLGAVPPAVYLLLFGYSASQAVELLPLRRWILMAPAVIAVVAGVAACATALGLVRLTRNRAGVVWPALVALAGGAACLFWLYVGPAELRYAMIVDGLAGGDLVLQPAGVAQWRTAHKAQGLNDQNFANRLRDYLRTRQVEMVADCDSFLGKYPSSRRAVEVLWLKAQCQSLQLDMPALNDGKVRYSASFPLQASAETWRDLMDQFPGSPQAALASWRLAVLALRKGDVDTADKYLAAAAARLEARAEIRRSVAKSGKRDGIFDSPDTIPYRGYYADALFRIRKLLWLIEVNDIADDPAAADALAAWVSESPCQDDYADRLGGLVDAYERTALGDNLKLAVAMAVDDPYMQAEMLIWLAEDERTDAAIEANYQLGMLVMQTARARALTLIPRIKTAPEYFRTVVAAPPNPWQDFAREHLAMPPSATEP
jgi:hypothetical protein